MSMLGTFGEVQDLATAIDALGYYMGSGGFVMPPLVLAAALMWYCLGYRWMLLKRGSQRSVRVILQNRLRGKGRPPDGIVDRAVVQGVALWERFGPGAELRRQLDGAYFDYVTGIKRYARLASTLVGIAPLLGLLGTVVGMIETFHSLADMSMHTQSGGIAAGIATALFTTQMGLVVAVPGVIVKALLDRRQQQIGHDLQQVKDMLCSLPRPA